MTDRHTFESLRNWVSQIQQHADISVNMILIGNKCDMESQRAVKWDEGKALADSYGIQFYETSAKQETNVQEAFVAIATEVKDRLVKDDPRKSNKTINVKPSTQSEKKSGGFAALVSSC